ncbi:MAG TPA: BrxA/BrxB family bacilliredoxin [Ignavibacteriaceae bacterium]|nr:BrxA/BrxB family bacilliredoxin [Ignavibacteriaceae bacterium]
MFNILSRPPMYDQDAVQPMRDELIAVGFNELLTPQQVDEAINVNDDKTVLVMINSVCGCAAGSARPGVSLALQNNIIPDKLYTGFAGQERDAVDRIRQYIKGFPPSSPSVALFKNGELIYFMRRMDIEGYSAEQIAKTLVDVFNDKCSAQGPSISPEQFEQVQYAKQCGSKIPLFKEN